MEEMYWYMINHITATSLAINYEYAKQYTYDDAGKCIYAPREEPFGNIEVMKKKEAELKIKREQKQKEKEKREEEIKQKLEKKKKDKLRLEMSQNSNYQDIKNLYISSKSLSSRPKPRIKEYVPRVPTYLSNSEEPI